MDPTGLFIIELASMANYPILVGFVLYGCPVFISRRMSDEKNGVRVTVVTGLGTVE